MSWQDVLKNDPAGRVLIDNQNYSVTFIVAPPEWHQANIKPALTWQSVKFLPTEKKKVPPHPGLYAFVARVPVLGTPTHGWIMYIGQAGDGTSSNTLRDRFGNYLANKRAIKGRPRVYFMLNTWDMHLEFFYSALPTRKHELKQLETCLLDAFRPPFTDRTYSATYMSPSHAF